MKIAILGATSHIAKGLIFYFSQEKDLNLFLFARTPQKVRDFLKIEKINEPQQVFDFSRFSQGVYDVIINCVGQGAPKTYAENKQSIFDVTELFDNLIIDYLQKHKKTLYVNLSSGAVYGTDFSIAASEHLQSLVPVNNLGSQDYYRLAKGYSEAKHRALPELNIVDLRIFSYFSRFIDISAGFLISDIIQSVKRNELFSTDALDIVRDYTHPADLVVLIKCCMTQHKVNDVFDVYSCLPITKFDLLKFFKEKYALNYVVVGQQAYKSATGVKMQYYSGYKKAELLGYKPQYSSLSGIEESVAYIL